jgi:glycosyltransferase involved in cell wall biosynthesis
VRRDATALEWRLKKWAYDRSKFTIVAPSKWLCDLTSQSMLRALPVRHIPHGIDTDVFRPLDQKMCRTLLGIPPGKQVLLFAVERLDRPLKGGDLLRSALHGLPLSVKRQTVLLFMGGVGRSLSGTFEMPVVDLGFVRSDRLKAIAFSAADLFLHPTRAENFPLVLLESFACGTPAVSFRVGGVPELVRPGLTGMLAEPENAAELREGMVHLLDDQRARQFMRERCREIAVAEYSLDMQVDRYLDLYRGLVNRSDLAPSGHVADRQPADALSLAGQAAAVS